MKDSRGRYVRDDLKRIVKEEKQKFIKDLFVTHTFLKDGITSYGATLTNKNEIAKKRCIVYDKYSGRHYTVGHTVDEVSEALSRNEDRVRIGFLAHLQRRR